MLLRGDRLCCRFYKQTQPPNGCANDSPYSVGRRFPLQAYAGGTDVFAKDSGLVVQNMSTPPVTTTAHWFGSFFRKM